MFEHPFEAPEPPASAWLEHRARRRRQRRKLWALYGIILSGGTVLGIAFYTVPYSWYTLQHLAYTVLVAALLLSCAAWFSTVRQLRQPRRGKPSPRKGLRPP